MKANMDIMVRKITETRKGFLNKGKKRHTCPECGDLHFEQDFEGYCSARCMNRAKEEQ